MPYRYSGLKFSLQRSSCFGLLLQVFDHVIIVANGSLLLQCIVHCGAALLYVFLNLDQAVCACQQFSCPRVRKMNTLLVALDGFLHLYDCLWLCKRNGDTRLFSLSEKNALQNAPSWISLETGWSASVFSALLVWRSLPWTARSTKKHVRLRKRKQFYAYNLFFQLLALLFRVLRLLR